MAPSGHEVRQGETLYSISRSTGIPVNQLIDLNPEVGRNPNMIKPGMALNLRKANVASAAPMASLSSALLAAPSRPAFHTSDFPSTKGPAHLLARHVQPPLMELEKVPMAACVRKPPLAEWVHHDGGAMMSLSLSMTGIRTSVRCTTSYDHSPPSPTQSSAGQKLRPPVKKPAPAERVDAKPHPMPANNEDLTSAMGAALKLEDQPKPDQQPTPRAAPPAPKRTIHTVCKGETLHAIARRYGVPVESLVALNNLTEKSLLMAGSKLVVQDFSSPLETKKYWVSSEFGPRWGRNHDGIDLAANQGTPIYAAQDGTVEYADWQGGYGKLLTLSHGGGYQTRYGHCHELVGKRGQKVKAGEMIGTVGNTGHSTGPHLHFEIRKDGKAINPKKMVQL
uniref:LysM domain-containing protein n=1 Tax=Pyramimonas obovata TaxID=1411642 RepID=A0A7S0WW61_9CHLO|mmetsp:Transcript_7169/g.14545  ORF Transcript_7169/g.14545 Transcript_7169/m.14545 type:complete len:393 (+) Transcript_7169:125-1303(+)|eukprot:CAMPEP_0118937942 /NCGR_PEP_ID=MMETSP1169-20130426/24339_1 /TAXON_ID=36882 /ORGANISM="Pyramimonas obovata, Strain CCMP722" /LENGTH=392 /DNA_ID=CAMNT_0006881739 /DNA_START=65 /DNA_END=1243 /DNA_ORIENTATION=+